MTSTLRTPWRRGGARARSRSTTPLRNHRDTATVRARVLVVEDDPVNRQVMCALLEQMGHMPLPAACGDEALALLDATTPIDVVVSDVVMPGMNGLDFARRARARRPDLPVVLVTGDSDAMESVLANGAVALLKPYSAATLERVVAESIAARRMPAA